MTEQKRTPSKRRERRVRRLKKMIILSIVAGILIPIILCIYLLIRVSSLERQLNELYASQILEETESEAAWSGLSGAENALQETVTVQSTSNEEIQTENAGKDAAQEEDPVEQEEKEEIKYVHLTFDDGPSTSTDQILDILKEYDVKATFFVNGREDEQSIARYQRIVAEGHTLGMHSYSHKYGEVYASKEAFIEDTEKLQKLLADVTGVKPTLYRFPGGSSNRVSGADMDELIDWLDEQGIAYFDWNISSGDSSSGGLSVQQIVSNCTGTIRNHEEPVILMHDSAAKKTTVEALPLVIEKIQAMEGVQMTAITEDTQPVHHIR